MATSNTKWMACGALALAYVVLRKTGLFGYCVIKINKDDSQESIWHGILWDTAYWNAADGYWRLKHASLRPIRFEYTNEFSDPFHHQPTKDGAGNKD